MFWKKNAHHAIENELGRDSLLSSSKATSNRKGHKFLQLFQPALIKNWKRHTKVKERNPTHFSHRFEQHCSLPWGKLDFPSPTSSNKMELSQLTCVPMTGCPRREAKTSNLLRNQPQLQMTPEHLDSHGRESKDSQQPPETLPAKLTAMNWEDGCSCLSQHSCCAPTTSPCTQQTAPSSSRPGMWG